VRFFAVRKMGFSFPAERAAGLFLLEVLDEGL